LNVGFFDLARNNELQVPLFRNRVKQIVNVVREASMEPGEPAEGRKFAVWHDDSPHAFVST
jgi:hypothetical protein